MCSCPYKPERQINSGGTGNTTFWYLMAPVMLRSAGHNQQGIVPQLKPEFLFFITFVLQLKEARFTKAERRDNRINTQLSFVVAVP